MSVESLTQALADHIGVPVIVFDERLNVAAFSVHEGDVDRDRLATILSRRATERARAAIREHRVDRVTGPVHIPPTSGGADRLMFAVRHRDLVVGYVSFIPDDHAGTVRADDAHARELRERIGRLLGRAAFSERDASGHTIELLSRLFESSAGERDRAADELRSSGVLRPASGLRVLVLTSRQGRREDDLVSALERLRAVLAAEGKVVGGFLQDEAVLIAPNAIDARSISATLVGERFADICAGIGESFTDLADAPSSRRHARIAVRGAIMAPTAYPAAVAWDELGLDRMLLQLPLEKATLSDLPSSVQRLLGATSGTDLVSTVEAYLDSGGDAQLTARRLHVHRSTLYYRLDRARELIGDDLADGRVRRELHTGLRIAALAGLR